MNLFRSEEHARRWSGFGDEQGLLPLDWVRTMWGVAWYRERLNGRFISRMGDYAEERNATRKAVTQDRPFWRPA